MSALQIFMNCLEVDMALLLVQNKIGSVLGKSAAGMVEELRLRNAQAMEKIQDAAYAELATGGRKKGKGRSPA